MRVLFVNDSTSNPNWGDRGSAIALRRMVEEAGGDVVYTLTEGDIADSALDAGGQDSPADVPRSHPFREGAKKLLPPAAVGLARRMRGGRTLIPTTWSEFPVATALVLGAENPWPALTRAIADSDVVVIHGDGAVTGNSLAARTMFFLAHLARRVFDKPVMMVNHTADLDHPGLREMAQQVYPLLDYVRFRDPISARRLEGVCHGAYAPDAAFLFDPMERSSWTAIASRPTYLDVWPDVAALDPTAGYLCLGGSSVLAHAEDEQRLLDGYRALIERIGSVYEGTIVLTVSDLVDERFFRRLAHEFGLPLIGLRTPVQQVVDLLGNADVYVGGRWHPSIFALRGGAPIVPLSAKTAKMQALAEMVGIPGDLPTAHDLESAVERLTRRIQKALGGGQGLRERLRSWAAAEAHASWDNVAYLSAK